MRRRRTCCSRWAARASTARWSSSAGGRTRTTGSGSRGPRDSRSSAPRRRSQVAAGVRLRHMTDPPDPPEEPTPADWAREIEDADRPSKPQEQRLRLQWNVPRGVQPYVPLSLALLMLGILALLVVLTLT